MKKRLVYVVTALLVAVNLLSGVTFAKEGADLPVMPAFAAKGAQSLAEYLPRGLKGAPSLPSFYTSRQYASGVDNQLSTELCWAFSHNELLEINLAKKYGEKYDFSEQAMKFETSNVTEPTLGYMRSPNGSGNEFYSTAYLARGGSVLESDEPFSASESRSVDKNALARYGRLVSVPMYNFGLNTGNEYRAGALDRIKSLVYEYGAAAACLYYSESSAYQPSDRHCYYYNGAVSAPNHEVTIIGWDDSYSADNFPVKPRGSGAFIVKNSWGLYHNDRSSDIVYISYYDRFITANVFATDYELENGVYDNTYQYDPLGCVAAVPLESETALCITRFSAQKKSETLTAVGIYVTDADMSVDIMVNTKCENIKSPTEYKTVYSGHFDAAGYYVLPIERTSLVKNEYYVAVRYIKSGGRASFAVQGNIRRLVDASVNVPNTCFIATDFTNITPIENVDMKVAADPQNPNALDTVSEKMLCIKAMTVNGTAPAAVAAAARFADVKSGSWYENAVGYSVGAGAFDGVSENMFDPNGGMTRAMFARVLSNITGIDTASYPSSPFTDIEKGRWYVGAVNWAYQNKIVNGIDASHFSPNEKITRQQMCVMLYRYAEYMGVSLPAGDGFVFDDDAGIQNYAKQAVYSCRADGIITGVTASEFKPGDYTTRAEVATLMMKFCQKHIY